MTEKKKEFVVRCKEWLRGVCGYNERGEEVLDPRPIEMPVGCERPESLAEMIARMVRDPVFRASLEGQGVETFEESNDFSIADDAMLESPWEEGNEFGTVMTKELEQRAGLAVATREDYERAREVIAEYERGRVRNVPGGVGPSAKAESEDGKMDKDGHRAGGSDDPRKGGT